MSSDRYFHPVFCYEYGMPGDPSFVRSQESDDKFKRRATEYMGVTSLGINELFSLGKHSAPCELSDVRKKDLEERLQVAWNSIIDLHSAVMDTLEDGESLTEEQFNSLDVTTIVEGYVSGDLVRGHRWIIDDCHESLGHRSTVCSWYKTPYNEGKYVYYNFSEMKYMRLVRDVNSCKRKGMP